MDQDALDVVVRELSRNVDAVYGVYLDGTAGFSRVLQNVIEGQAATLSELSKTNPELATIEYLDTVGFAYGTGHPASPATVIQHITTQGDIKDRNRDGGRNYVFLANMCIITIYQLWEEHFRAEVANAMNVEPADLKVPVFGDLRHLRNAIVHNLGVATMDLDKCKVLRWFEPGVPIAPTKQHVREIIDAIYAYIDSLPASKALHPSAAWIPGRPRVNTSR